MRKYTNFLLFRMFDRCVKNRLAGVVRELRGDRSQREFAEILNVGQATIQSWESERGGTPALDSLIKIANLRKENPEVFIAYLFGRPIDNTTSIEAQIENMPIERLIEINLAIAKKIAAIGLRKNTQTD
jgi:transcriptional regulator with XRE-family HTH domain